MPNNVTSVDDVQLPVEDVELTSRALRRRDGRAVVVRCEFIEEMQIVGIAQALPGHAPELGVKKDKTPNLDMARDLLRYAPPVIEAGVSMVRADGSVVRPAFYFGDDPGNGALPGRYLSDADKLKLFSVCMRLSGYAGGAVASAKFPGGKRARGRGGKRTVGAGRRNRA